MNVDNCDISPWSRSPLLFSYHRDCPSQATHKFHFHDYTELFFYVSGDVDFLVDDRYLSMAPGSILLIRRNLLHRPFIKSDRVYERFYFGVPDDFFDGMDRAPNPLAFWSGESCLLRPDRTVWDRIYKLARQICNAQEEGERNREYLCFSWFLQLLHLLDGSQSRQGVNWTAEEDGLSSPLVREVLAYIQTHLTEISSVRELAERFHVNPAYLSALFSGQMNVTLKQYLTAKRISAAKNSLRDGKTVSETAYECGFSSPSHLITVFRATTGLTPGTYQAEHR